MTRLCLLLSAALLCGGRAAAEPDPIPGNSDRSTWYASGGPGYWSDPDTYVRVDAACEGLSGADAVSCSLDAFRARPFTVIAFIDTGINPYAHDFRAPEFVHHPSSYLEGYPTDAQALHPSFDVDDYEEARLRDIPLWISTEREKLYWFPGTRIVGAVSISEGDAAVGRQDFKVLDDDGHGTGVASVAAGRFFGANPNALIVAVEGLGDESLRWAASQPWIDIVSNSWGTLANLPLGQVSATRAGLDAGKVVAFAAGNGTSNRRLPVVGFRPPDRNVTYTSAYTGPREVVTVGAASPVNGQSYWWHSVPPDVSSFGSFWPAASAFSTTEWRNFGGTSCATPVTAGVLSAGLLHARTLLGDTAAGPKPAGLAVGVPAGGMLADGALTRDELQDAVLKTAFPVPFDPEDTDRLDDYTIYPTTDLYYVHTGYGVVDAGSRTRALQVLDGRADLPERPDVDAWMRTSDTVRDAFWSSAMDVPDIPTP